MKKVKNLIPLGFVCLLFMIQCKSVPLTGRSQLAIIGNDKLFPSSFQQYEEVKKEGNVITGTPQSDMIKRVGSRIQKAVERYFAEKGNPDYLSDYKWEFNLIKDDKAVNAWCMPGGKVAFYTAILPICKDEQGIAVVMGHEVAHAIANHGAERISQQQAAQIGLSAVGVALGQGANVGGVTIPPDVIMQGAGAATNLGVLAFSRKHESEADEMGLYFMAMAGYDPSVAPQFWERMSTMSGGGSQPEFLSTHPSHGTRIADLNKHMPKALKYYKASED